LSYLLIIHIHFLVVTRQGTRSEKEYPTWLSGFAGLGINKHIAFCRYKTYIQYMKFVWDEIKNTKNIQKHGIEFKDAAEMFNYPMLSTIDTRQNYGEERWVGIGFLKDIIAVVAYTENETKKQIRIISARKATKNESQKFKKSIGN